ncbi:MAG: ThiF family adenylyltransferase [Thermoleophilia bacterium]|nr:ThiF family adenylyltransferase [Thermoleophilia bacterium]
MLLALTDEVLDQIEECIASHPPERGGALLGPVGLPIATLFVFDPGATTSGASFRASAQLTQMLKDLVRHDPGLEFKGVLHSHPGSFDRPSSQDQVAFEDNLRRNPWLGRVWGPIVTRGPAEGSHEAPLASGKVSFFVGEPLRGGGLEVTPVEVKVIPIGQDLAALADLLGGRVEGRASHAYLPGLGFLIGGTVALEEGRVTYLASEHYPAVAPIVMIEAADGLMHQAATEWLIGVEHRDRLIRMAAAVDACVPGRRAKQRAAGVADSVGADASCNAGGGGSSDSPAEEASVIAASEGAVVGEGTPGVSAPRSPSRWRRRLSRRERVRAGIQARLTDVVPSPLRDRSVAVIGAGSVGSGAAEGLVRAGVERIWLVDPDRVEAVNLSRTVYDSHDVGRLKVRALRRRLRRINPAVRVRAIAKRFEDLGEEGLRNLLQQVDLVFSSADDPLSQYAINHWAYALGVPAVYVGIYAKGHAGEVVAAIPGLTRCLRCAVPRRTQREGRRSDYGTGRLVAEPALGTDILHVTTAAVKMAVAILAAADPTSPQAVWLLDNLGEPGHPRSYLVMSTVPGYSFFPEVFGATAGQAAYQAVWLSPDGSDDCPVCGTEPVPPVLSAGPDVEELRHRAAALSKAEPRSSGAEANIGQEATGGASGGSESPAGREAVVRNQVI